MNSVAPRLLISAAAISLTLGLAAPVFSATDMASSDITLQFSENIIITNVDPVTIADPVTGSNAMGSDTFCIAGTGFSTFNITFANTGTDPTFRLMSSNGTGAIIYEVLFADTATGPANPVFAGIPVNGQPLQASDCSNDDARFDIEIPFSEWNDREDDGPFTGTMMITVESE
ncbi:hypothetical protein MO867_20600 [Microbulbifer sp. OS29]|uniref:Uncharacterized protein n=1 Tax=Microbulbifer okhotskensis TaxID=2926617 RepID=A0A9X2ES07_9GAMM|nr:hypothetical protein [Microbulbifer okhotskensis]MCO1336731.1 hypothetical protein [Microbulbifer okhotskensis]